MNRMNRMDLMNPMNLMNLMNLTHTSRVSLLGLVFVAAAVAATGCKKEEAPPPPPSPAPAAAAPPVPAPPAAGTDADTKRIEAQALATATDAALATFTKSEKEFPPDASGSARKAEAWTAAGPDGKRQFPKKVVISRLDDKGVVQETTDLYFDERGRLQYARAPDGLFIFQNESLALWLDREQRVKRGLNPGVVTMRVEALKKEMVEALGLFNLR